MDSYKPSKGGKSSSVPASPSQNASEGSRGGYATGRSPGGKK